MVNGKARPEVFATDSLQSPESATSVPPLALIVRGVEAYTDRQESAGRNQGDRRTGGRAKMRSGLGLAAVAAVLAGSVALPAPALADEQTKSSDTHLVLPDQPAGDDELQQASGAPPQAPA